MIHLGIGFDRNYLRPLYAWIASVEENNPGQKIFIHAMCLDIPPDELKKIENKIRKFGDIVFYPVDAGKVAEIAVSGQWTAAVYFRLFLPMLIVATIDRLLYMDLDTLVLKDLGSLYQLDLLGHPVAAVYDNYVRLQPLIDIHEEGNYFNSGVLLIDLRLWNRLSISQTALAFLKEHPDKILFVDQCALNAVLKNNWLKIPETFNLLYSYIPSGLSRQQLNVFLTDKVIIHFTLQRPWEMLCKNRFRHLYFRYLKMAGVNDRTKYPDFSMVKIPAWVNIRLMELYFDFYLLQKIWRFIKKMVPGKFRSHTE